MAFRSILLCVTVLMLSTGVNSATIALDDWWLQTDDHGGLRQSVFDESIYFAVFKNTTAVYGDTYETPTGMHWATHEEYITAVNDFTGIWTNDYKYYNQGGWSGYQWEGKARHQFLFSGTPDQYAHAGNFEYTTNFSSQLYSSDSLAGLVLIKDASVVPVPAAVWLFGSGLLGLVGVARRKKS